MLSCLTTNLAHTIALYHTPHLKEWFAMPPDCFTIQAQKIYPLCIGAGLVTYSYAQSMESNDNDQPAAVQQAQYPKLSSLWARQVASDSTSMAYNLSSWIPQVQFHSTNLQVAYSDV